jgi:soluble lytic murein transglycosylase-like protein
MHVDRRFALFGTLPIRLALSVLAFCVPTLARADVLAIGDDGAVTRYDRPAVYLGPDIAARPIQPPAPSVRTSAPNITSANSAVAQAIETSAAAHGISRDLAYAVAWHESRFRADAFSPKGAIGVMQLMPATARTLRVDPYDAVSNVEGGVTFLSRLMQRYDGDLVKTLAAYNAGPAAVDRYRGIPPYRETQAYVASILGSLAKVVTP